MELRVHEKPAGHAVQVLEVRCKITQIGRENILLHYKEFRRLSQMDIYCQQCREYKKCLN